MTKKKKKDICNGYEVTYDCEKFNHYKISCNKLEGKFFDYNIIYVKVNLANTITMK